MVLLPNAPYHFLYPAILIITLMGVYANANNRFAVFSVLGFTALGIRMICADIPVTPFILSFVVGPTLETNFRNAVSYAHGDRTSFFTHPVSCILLLAAIGSEVLPLIKGTLASVKTKQ